MTIIDTEDYVGPDRRTQPSRFQRLVDQAIDNGIVLGAIAFSLFTILGVMSFAIIQTNENARDATKRSADAVRCVLHEQISHRTSTASFHRENAHHHGFNYAQLELPVAPDALGDSCRRFFDTATANELFGPEDTPGQPDTPITTTIP